MRHKHPIYGIMAEFPGPTELVVAAKRAYEAGYRHMDGYSPFPIEELSHAIGFHKTRLPLIVLIGGIVGCLTGFGLQYWVSVVAYPLNIGGKPLNSWPSFIPVTFEVTVLFAALSAVIGLIALNGLPRPYHPVFNVDRFELASRTHFFLCIESSDALFDREKTAEFLKSLNASEVNEVAY